jgi:hypothetical protein
MKTLNKHDDIEAKFSELLGDDVIFFNKDEEIETPFYKREQALDHDDECECLECEKD